MGLPPFLLIPLLIYDVIMNILLIGLSIYFLAVMLKFRHGRTGNLPGLFLCRKEHTRTRPGIQRLETAVTISTIHSANTSPNNPVEQLIKRTLLGCLLVLVPTVVNVALLLRFNGFEQGWLCFSLCSMDVTWAVCVVHWLTNDVRDTSYKAPILPPVRPEAVRMDSGIISILEKEP